MYPSASPPSFRISHEGIRAEWHNGECHFRKAGGCPPCNTITPVPNIPYPDIDCKHNFPVPASIFHSSLNTDLIGKSPIKIGTSETSFCNAAGGAEITSVFATLDKIHREISSTENGFHNTTAAGAVYGVLLQKGGSGGQSYSGIAFSYATMSIVYFAYVTGTFYIKIYG